MFIPKTPRLHNQLNVDNQDATNSSQLDSFDQDNNQSPFDSLNQFGAPSDTLGWRPWFFRTDASSSTQPLFVGARVLRHPWRSLFVTPLRRP